MPMFKYRAVNSLGEPVQGTYTAGDRTMLLQTMKEKELHVTRIEEIVERKDSDVLASLQKVSTKDLAVFCRQFSTMLTAGVTIFKALDILQQQTENRKLRSVITNLFENVQKGSSFSSALKNHRDVFPELLINMVEAGELSGTLDSIMARMAVNFEKDNKIKSKVKAAMVYPIVLSVVAVLVVIFLLTFIMPMFFSMFEQSGVELPAPTKLLIGLSGIIRAYWYIILAIVVAAVYFGLKFKNSNKGAMAWDRFKLRIPVLKGVLVKIITARFTRTLSTLLASGIPLLQAMEVVAKIINNRVVAQGVMDAREEMRRGMDLSGPIKRIGIFPPMVDSMIKIGEESGTLDSLLEKAADFYDDEVDAGLQKLVSLVEPLLIVIMGGIIGFIVISMALPMFSMMETIQ